MNANSPVLCERAEKKDETSNFHGHKQNRLRFANLQNKK